MANESIRRERKTSRGGGRDAAPGSTVVAVPPAVATGLLATLEIAPHVPCEIRDRLGLVHVAELAPKPGREPQDFDRLTRARGAVADDSGLFALKPAQVHHPDLDRPLEHLGHVAAVGLAQGGDGHLHDLDLVLDVLPSLGSAVIALARPIRVAPAIGLVRSIRLAPTIGLARMAQLLGQFDDGVGALATALPMQLAGGEREQLDDVFAAGRVLADVHRLLVASPLKLQLARVQRPLEQVGRVVPVGIDEPLHGVAHDGEMPTRLAAFGVGALFAIAALLPLAAAAEGLVESARDAFSDVGQVLSLFVAPNLPQRPDAPLESFEHIARIRVFALGAIVHAPLAPALTLGMLVYGVLAFGCAILPAHVSMDALFELLGLLGELLGPFVPTLLSRTLCLGRQLVQPLHGGLEVAVAFLRERRGGGAERCGQNHHCQLCQPDATRGPCLAKR
ncbi:MAG: hypothetical protein IID31_08945 [Planctomycetes bacterium]|nr:hypothetical protein [Planctomycetota bacterium]